MAEFRCTVVTSSGIPVANAAIRVVSDQNIDATVALFGSSPVYTKANGTYAMPAPPKGSTTGNVPAGVYTINVVAPGYQPKKYDTLADFTGTGTFRIELTVDTSAAGEITTPASDYVSPMAPVEVEVPGVASSAKWEYIEATITSESGNESVIEVPTSNGSALLNLQARCELDTALYLVGDDKAAAIDPSFSDTFTVVLASLTPSGRQDLNVSFSLQVANVFPTGEENDLGNFTNEGGPADWMTPWDELPKFRGHVADAMIWLPVAKAQYTLQVTYKNINRVLIQSVDIALDSALFKTKRVVRVRIPEAIPGAVYAGLVITSGGVPQTKTLTVRYHG